MYNREDCCPERLNNFTLTVGARSDGYGNAVCVQNGGNVSQQTEIISNCSPALKGRYVHVRLIGNRVLSLCEIEIYEARGMDFLVFTKI